MRNKRAIAQALSAIAIVIVDAAAAIGTAAGGPGKRRYSPQTYPDARPARRPARNARGVERAVIDQWLLWRN